MLQIGDLTLQIGGVQGMEWIILIVVVVVLLFGAKKLPELAKSFGRATGEYQKGREEVDREIRAMKAEEEMSKIQQTATATPQSSQPTPTKAALSEMAKLLKAAKELGIETEGKTETELREEIAKAMMR